MSDTTKLPACHSQWRLTIDVGCGCTFGVRVRYSRFLHAYVSPPATGANPAPAQIHALAQDDGSGWTTITTPVAGTCILEGSFTKLFD